MPHGSFFFSLALMPLAGAQLTMSQIGLAERQVVADTMSRVAASRSWKQQEIGHAGRHLYVPENHYAGGIAIDPNNINQVYLSTEVDPATGKPGETGRTQIFRGTTSDQGAKWTWQQLTFDPASDNIRPYLPRQKHFSNCILWMRGRYDTYIDYDTDIVGILEK